MKSTFSVIFYLKRQAVKKDGTVPVMGRITVDGTQTQFSSKLSVDPKLWDTKGGRVTGRSSAALETNRLLDKMRVSINRHYQEIMERDNFVTAEKVKNAFLGLEHRCHTLMQVFRQHNEDYAKQVEAGMKAKATLSKYLVVYKHLQEFLNIRYHVKDIALKELTPAFISDFEMFLRTDKHCCTNTAQSVTDGQAVRLRLLEPMAVAEKIIPRNAVLVGAARIQGERLGIAVTSLEHEGTIIPVELSVYDTDGQEGIFIPNSMEMNAVREVAANMGGSLGSSINISTDAKAQLASDLGKGLIQGTSQYIAKKMRTVKVHLKAGYRVMLYQDRN